MKKICFILFLIPLAIAATAQPLTTSLNVNQPPAAISEWISNNTVIIYTVTNPDIPRNVIIKADIKTVSGEVVATKDLSKSQVFSIPQGTRIFNGKEVMPLETMVFSPAYTNTLEKTGKLPAGTYQLEVVLISPVTLQPVSAVQLRMFNLAALQLPILLMPLENAALDAKTSETAITFRWTPLSPVSANPGSLPRYRLQVFQVHAYQEPLQALRGNPALLDVLITAQTQYIWRPQLPFSTDSTLRKFVWAIQTVNAQNQPVIMTDGNGEARSEPRLFFIEPSSKLKTGIQASRDSTGN